MTDTQQQPSDEPIGYVSAGWAEHRVGHATVYPQPIKRVATYPVYAAPARADSAPIASEPVEQLIADESDGAWAAFEKSPNAEMSNRDDLWQIWHEGWVAARSAAAPAPIAPTADAMPVAWFRKTDITELTDSEPETDGWTPLYAAEKVTADAVAPVDMYVWFAEPAPVYGSDGERFIRSWTDDPEKVAPLRDAIGKEPMQYRAALAPSAVEQTASEHVEFLGDNARDQLIEKMARAMNVATDGHDRYWSGYVDSATAAHKVVSDWPAAHPASAAVDVRASVLEEAAKMVEQWIVEIRIGGNALRNCAVAIRALKDKS